MGRLRVVSVRAWRIDPRVADAVVSAVLAACAIADARDRLPSGSFGVEAVICCTVCAGSVAWRRLRPAWACVAACTGWAALAVSTGYNADGVFEWVPVILTFYTLGRQDSGSGLSIRVAGPFAYWVLVSPLIFWLPAGGSPAGALGLWPPEAVSFAIGRWFGTRQGMIDELAAQAEALEREQTLRAREAVDEERRGLARELHDVVAHCVSVMVVQTVGARSVAHGDAAAARRALEAVERAGREALVELRRIVGVLRHDRDRLADAATPTLAQLPVLAERARAAGVPVELRVDGPRRELPPGLELVAYRLVQEALTNVIKHAGQASAQVRLSYEADELRVGVSDSGGGSLAVPHTSGIDSGHGLHGMRERVALYGGEVETGPLPAGGFAVRARIPYAGRAAEAPLALGPGPGADARAGDDRLRWPWLDPLLAAVTLVAVEQSALAANHVRGPLVLSVIAGAGIALGAVRRRRWPLVFAITVVTLDLVLIALGPLKNSVVTVFLWAWVMYTLAAWTDRRIASAGLAGIVGLFTVGQVRGTNHANAWQFAGLLFAICVLWGCGYAMRSRRRITRQLVRLSSQLRQEREDRARLAVASERSRIARELHAAVAHSVAAMVVQAEAAAMRLEQDAGGADPLMEAIEHMGRTTLADMRRILGVLRHPGESAGREPQPGVGQIHTLISRARESGQAVQMTINGEPGALPPGVEVGLYRILREALLTARDDPTRPVDVSLSFGEEALELRVFADVNGWPTDAMREWASMCDGELTADHDPTGRCGLLARMPTALQGAFA